MITFMINGVSKQVKAGEVGGITLLELLRERYGLTEVKEGCKSGDCGACTVLLDGKPVNSCLVLASELDGREITTIGGLESDPLLLSLRESFLEVGAVQCGYCTPAMLLTAYSLIKLATVPITEEEIRRAIAGNTCRCTGYQRIVDAIKLVVEKRNLLDEGG